MELIFLYSHHLHLLIKLRTNILNTAQDRFLNDTFLYFDLITHAEQMLSKGEDFRIIGNKLLIIPQNSPISEKKKETALYKAVNSEFSDMAIKNKFILKSNIYKIPIAIRLLIVYDRIARYGKPKRLCFSGKIPVSTTIL